MLVFTSAKRSIALALLIGALTLATLTSLQLYFNWRLFGAPGPYAAIWAAEALEWTLWAAFAPVVWWVERRWGTATGHVARGVAVHLLLLVVFFLVVNALMTGLSLEFGLSRLGRGGFTDIMLRRASRNAISALLVYGLILGAAVLARESARRSRQRMRLEAELSDARLRYLRAQIQPHFLFNTLHGIAGMVREGERGDALATIEKLGHLLRRALSVEAGARLELGEELDDLAAYVEIQRMRFGDRLEFTSDVPLELETVLVPGLILQPLVENAIRHGIRPEGGHVHISAAREDGAVVLRVRDDGIGLPRGYEEGIGLGNLRQRLETIYGDAAELEVRNVAPGSGVEVRIRLPERMAGDD